MNRLRAFPGEVRGFLRRQQRQWVLGRTVRAIRALPPGTAIPVQLLEDLRFGWGNEGWSAGSEYLGAIGKAAEQASGPILECGSGLSTLLLGIIADRNQTAVWSLEHDPVWAERVRRALRASNIASVSVLETPLRSFGDFSWYDVSRTTLPGAFAMVVCDGPPGSTPGGRNGLLPLMGSRLAPGCRIFLDDVERSSEQSTLAAWARDLETTAEIGGVSKPYGILVVPGGPRPPAKKPGPGRSAPRTPSSRHQTETGRRCPAN